LVLEAVIVLFLASIPIAQQSLNRRFRQFQILADGISGNPQLFGNLAL